MVIVREDKNMIIATRGDTIILNIKSVFKDDPKGKAMIDTTLCTGCKVCTQLCRFGAL